MASSSSDKKAQNRKKTPISMLNDLLRAQELTHQLNEKINGSTEVKDLIDQILNTFSRVISDLKTPEESASVESSEVSNGKRKFTDEADQKMNSRKRPRSACTRKVISKTIEDGQAWRKYGQKKILNSEHPRSYFRCTHKFDQGCKATKLVQRLQEDPNLHTITYTGNHTCKDPSMTFPHHIVSTSSLDDNSCIISFGSNTNTNTNTNTNAYTNINKTNQEGLTSPQSYQSMDEEVLSNLTTATATATDPTVAQISKQLDDQIDELCPFDFDTSFDLVPFLNLADFELGAHLG